MNQRKTCASLGILLVACLTAPLSGAGDPAEALYASTLVRERGLRMPGASPRLEDLRTAISGYEMIARRYPSSKLHDHALWQGAGLAIEAFDMYRQPQEFEAAGRLLRKLELEHPRSTFTSRVPERLAQLDALTTVAWLSDIKRDPLPRGTRIVVSVNRKVKFASKSLQYPHRLLFDLRGTETVLPLRNATLLFNEDPTIIRIRLGHHPNDVTRVVLDLRDDISSDCHWFTLYDPFRLVVDCIPEKTAPRPELRVFVEPQLVRLPSLGTPTNPSPLTPAIAENDVLMLRALDPITVTTPRTRPSTNSNGVFSVARQLGLGVSRIVIDPGHGGRDPGARRDGLNEADLVLDVALRLKRRLANVLPQLEVILTRRDDVYLSLEDRTDLANRVEADLFLSIHANASANHDTRGVETYFLNLATDPEVEARVARENTAAEATMKHLERLIERIATNTKIEESRDFAKAIQAAMVDRLRPIDPALPDLGVKQAPFIVLIGARMPSALSEIAFLTNERDASLVASEAYRDHLANALLEGIVRYQQSLGIQPKVAITRATF